MMQTMASFQRFKGSSLVYGLLIGVLFVALYFNPVTRANIAFAIRTDPDMSGINTTDMSWVALVYFATAGLFLGALRLVISQRAKGPLSLPTLFGLMIVGSVASIYVALRLLNPALACMLEECNSSFLVNYALVTLGMSSVLAYNNKFLPQDPAPQPRPKSGCSSYSGMLLLLFGLILVVAGMVIFYFFTASIGRGSC
jgi:hypothetical protein